MQGTVLLEKLATRLTEDIRLTYEMTETPIDPAVAELREGNLTTYGVTVTKYYEDTREELTVRDISTDRDTVVRLLGALCRGGVTPVAVPDVVDDYMALLFWS